MVNEFCRAALDRCKGKNKLASFFEAFIQAGPRDRVPLDELLDRLKIGVFSNAESRLRGIVTDARGLAWEMAKSPSPGAALPSNIYLLMPTILSDTKCVNLERIVLVDGHQVAETFGQLYSHECSRLDEKSTQGALTEAELAQLGTLSYLLSRHGKLRTEAFAKVFFEFDIIENLRRTDLRVIDIARIRRSGELVVLKRLTADGAQIERERLAFTRGAEAVEQIRDPSIPGVVVPWSERGGTLFYAVKHRPGIPLLEAGVLDRSTAIMVLVQIAGILRRLHDNGLMHGDLSLDNILQAPNGDISLIDFECAAPIETSQLSRSYARVTTYFMSPERRSDPMRLTPSDDVYAFGALAARLLTSSVDQSPDEHVALLRRRNPQDVMLDFLGRCLSDERAGRFATAAEMDETLRSLLRVGRPSKSRPIIRFDARLKIPDGPALTGRSFANLDLRNLDFSGKVISQCDFANSLLSNATFQNANIADSCFDGAFMLFCRFHDTVFLPNVSFEGANLERTVWDNAEVASVDFAWANFWGAFLSRMQGFDSAKIEGTNFFRNELTSLQRQRIDALGSMTLNAGSYGTMISAWQARDRPLVWWLDEISRPGGLVGLY